MRRLPKGFDEWMFRGGKQVAGGLQRVGECAPMELVANGDTFLGGQIGTMQCVLYHLVAPARISVLLTPIACPNTDRLGLKRNSGGQHGGKMQSIGRTRRKAVVGTIRSDIKPMLAR